MDEARKEVRGEEAVRREQDDLRQLRRKLGFS